MGEFIINILGTIYTKVPKDCRPYLKTIYYWLIIRLQAILSVRRYYKAKNVKFIDFEIADLRKNEFLGPGRGEVLVEVHKSIISPGTENAVLSGLPGAIERAFPYSPGYSAAGRIIKVGSCIKSFKKGDRVTGRVNHASHMIVPETFLFPIPEGVSYEEAAFIELGIIILQGIRKSGIRPGYQVAVVGQGLIGQLCNRIARLSGATEVIAVARSRNRSKTALKSGGATHFLAISEEANRLGCLQADLVIEAVGSPNANLTAFECARRGGKVILLGSSRGLGRNVNWLQTAQKKELKVIGAHIGALPAKDQSCGRWTYYDEGLLFLDLLKSKRLRVTDFITWAAKPEECNAVYETIAAGGGQNVAIMFDWITNE